MNLETLDDFEALIENVIDFMQARPYDAGQLFSHAVSRLSCFCSTKDAVAALELAKHQILHEEVKKKLLNKELEQYT